MVAEPRNIHAHEANVVGKLSALGEQSDSHSQFFLFDLFFTRSKFRRLELRAADRVTDPHRIDIFRGQTI
jgi:hypothetical protein